VIENPIRDAEVLWYRKNGKYPLARIVLDKHGNEYVIGDWSWSWSWNRQHGLHEVIEPIMEGINNATRQNKRE
jgi:hypothetical protein